MSEMKPCPFCGSGLAKRVGRCIECRRCGASGPESLTGNVDDMIRTWNRRDTTAFRALVEKVFDEPTSYLNDHDEQHEAMRNKLLEALKDSL